MDSIEHESDQIDQESPTGPVRAAGAVLWR